MALRSKIVVIFVFLILQNTIISQNKKLDSLKKIVATTKTDSTLLKNLIELSRLCSKLEGM
jgi:hypothetical protein